MRVARVDIDAVIPTRSKLRGALGRERFLLLWRIRPITERKRRSDVREFGAPEFTMRVHAFALASFAAVTGAMAAAYGQVAGQSAPSPPAQMTIAGCLKASPNPSGVPDTTTYTLEPIEAVAPTAPASSTGARNDKTAIRYTLTSSAGIAFKPHVGYKVEISGHLKDLSG